MEEEGVFRKAFHNKEQEAEVPSAQTHEENAQTADDERLLKPTREGEGCKSGVKSFSVLHPFAPYMST